MSGLVQVSHHRFQHGRITSASVAIFSSVIMSEGVEEMLWLYLLNFITLDEASEKELMSHIFLSRLPVQWSFFFFVCLFAWFFMLFIYLFLM